MFRKSFYIKKKPLNTLKAIDYTKKKPIEYTLKKTIEYTQKIIEKGNILKTNLTN